VCVRAVYMYLVCVPCVCPAPFCALFFRLCVDTERARWCGPHPVGSPSPLAGCRTCVTRCMLSLGCRQVCARGREGPMHALSQLQRPRLAHPLLSSPPQHLPTTRTPPPTTASHLHTPTLLAVCGCLYRLQGAYARGPRNTGGGGSGGKGHTRGRRNAGELSGHGEGTWSGPPSTTARHRCCRCSSQQVVRRRKGNRFAAQP
jgi:hypothetical protein